MAERSDIDAMSCTPARSYKERLEQALMWLLWELDSDQSGHGGVQSAVADLLPEFDTRKLADKGYPYNWPDSYASDERSRSG